MKKNLRLAILTIVVLVLSLSVTINAFAFSAGQCTWYAASHFTPGVNWTGNGGDWYANAKAKGWTVSSDVTKPMVGAIVVWGGGIDPATKRAYGHVAIVESITIDKNKKITSITIGEANWDKSAEKYGSKDVTHVTLTLETVKKRGSHPFTGYIYRTPVPKKK